jgi:hypothetical protein
MSINKPFHRNCRQFSDGSYTNSGMSRYIRHHKYAKAPEQYIRAFLLIQKDLHNLFDYIEPSDTNLKSYSFRVHELLMRTCIEVEANLRAILIENGYSKTDEEGKKRDLEMDDYKKVEKTHKLSSYQVKLPHWYGEKSVRKPFLTWSRPEQFSPAWYQAYNKTKHDRQEEFSHANLGNLIDAICGLLVLLSSQFYTLDFSPADSLLSVGDDIEDGMESAIGSYFRVKFPDWAHDERYSFTYKEWEKMAQQESPFQKIDYLKIA